MTLLPSLFVAADLNVGAAASVTSISSNLSISTVVMVSIPSVPLAVIEFVFRSPAGLEKVSV